MNEMLREQSKKYITGAFFEWVGWIVGSVLLIMLVRWASIQYGASEQAFHIWISGTVYLWYVSTMSLVVGGTYFIARAAQTYLERRQNHPEKPDSVDLTSDIARVIRIKNKAAIVAIVLHIINGVFVYYVSGHVPGITDEYRIYAVLGVFAVAAIKPAFSAINTIRIEIWGMLNEADYPVNSVAELWKVVNEFGDYEKRLEYTFSEIESARETHEHTISNKLDEITEKLKDFRGELITTFESDIKIFKESDSLRQQAYTELKDAQMPVIKEISKVLEAIQTLREFVIELRNKNIKGEQLMSALKEFGIDSLAELNVTFQKSVVNRNPEIREAFVSQSSTTVPVGTNSKN
ncbi:hypothetical protein MNBD_GAMMA11-2278 [hydrothermal vent metagenome]|uniref:Uncharacterized protein n=1 Tax=hydrothermal vent metagenome TaxID=652676 RepID=A0A3B0XU39_9ZZZZ